MHYERLECLFFVSSIAYFKSNFRRGLRRVLVRFKMNFHVNNFIYKCSTIVLLRLLTLLNVDDQVWFTFIYRFYTCIKWNFPQVSIAFHKTHLLKCDTFMSYTQSNCIYYKYKATQNLVSCIWGWCVYTPRYFDKHALSVQQYTSQWGSEFFIISQSVAWNELNYYPTLDKIVLVSTKLVCFHIGSFKYFLQIKV